MALCKRRLMGKLVELEDRVKRLPKSSYRRRQKRRERNSRAPFPKSLASNFLSSFKRRRQLEMSKVGGGIFKGKSRGKNPLLGSWHLRPRHNCYGRGDLRASFKRG